MTNSASGGGGVADQNTNLPLHTTTLGMVLVLREIYSGKNGKTTREIYKPFPATMPFVIIEVGFE